MTDKFISILKVHTTLYPEMKPQDAFKLAYQNEYGAAHLIEDYDNSLERIQSECIQLENSHAPYILSVGNGYSRVDLKSVSEGIITAEKLNEIFCKTANFSSTGNIEGFYKKITVISECLHLFDFSQDELSEYYNAYISIEPHAVSHSSQYRALYHPHYRVVLDSLLLSNHIV